MPLKPTDALRQRLHLVEANRALLPVILGKVGSSANGQVVILADVRDPLGRDLAQAAVEKSGGLDLGRETARSEARGEIPTAVVVVPLLAARMLFADTHPEVAKGLVAEPPLGRVRVVSIAAGGAVLVHANVGRSAPSGQA